jgi:putative membrane protein
MMYGYDGWGGPVLHSMGGILMIVSTLVVVLVVFVLMRNTLRQRENGDSDRALAILRERFARGELTKDQFEQMKRDLE